MNPGLTNREMAVAAKVTRTSEGLESISMIPENSVAKTTINALKTLRSPAIIVLSISLCITVNDFSAACAQPLEGAEKTPNIVVIFMDDMGYADIGPFGGDKSLTPNLNRMAEEATPLGASEI